MEDIVREDLGFGPPLRRHGNGDSTRELGRVERFTRRHRQHGLEEVVSGVFSSHIKWPIRIVFGCATGRRKHTVDLHLAVRDNGLDLSLLLEVLEALAGQGAVDLEPVDEGGDGDETVGLDVLVQLVGGGLVEDDGVLRLVLDCSRLLAGDATLEGETHRGAADFWRRRE